LTLRLPLKGRSRLLLCLLLGSGFASAANDAAGFGTARPSPRPTHVVTWRGGADRLWSNPANWVPPVTPGLRDVARFDERSTDSVMDAASASLVGAIVLESGFSGVIRLGRDVEVPGSVVIAGGVLDQGPYALGAGFFDQTGGRFGGGDRPLVVSGEVRVRGGLLSTPAALMRVRTLDIRRPGVVRMAARGKLEITGDGTPLRGDGLLDTSTNRPTSVEYTGSATTDLTSAAPATALRPSPGTAAPKARFAGARPVLGRGRSPLAFGSAETALSLYPGENQLVSAVLDPAAGMAYFGSTSDMSYPTGPGVIVKVRLSDFTRVAAITLNVGEEPGPAAAIDPTGGFAYFGTDATPGVVVKIRLSDFTRADSLSLGPHEGSLTSAVIDPGGGFAYFTAGTAPGRLIKLRLSDFTRVGALTGAPGENDFNASVIDPSAGILYVGTFTSPGIVVKVRLSDFSRVAGLSLDAGEGYIRCGAIDATAGFAYFGTLTAPGIVIRVRLGDFTRDAALSLGTSEDNLYAAAIDTGGGFLYAASVDYSSWSGAVVKIRLADFSRVSRLDLATGELRLYSALMDAASGFAYFGAGADVGVAGPGVVVKVRLSDFTRQAGLPLDLGEGVLTAAAIDPANGYAYFGTDTDPGIIVKIRLSDFARVGAVTPGGNAAFFRSAVLDPAGGFAYFGTDAQLPPYVPALIVKLRLSDFTVTDTMVLDVGATAGPAVIDVAAGFAYFVEGGQVIKVRLSDFTDTGRLAGPGEPPGVADGSAAIDPAAGYAYFGTSSSIVRLRLSDFSWAGTLSAGPVDPRIHFVSAALDPAAGFGYFGTNGTDATPGTIAKVRLSDFTLAGSLTFDAGERLAPTSVLDPAAGFLYVGLLSQHLDPHGIVPSSLARIRLFDFSRAGTQTLLASDYDLSSGVFDPTSGLAYFGTSAYPGRVLRFDLNATPSATATVGGGAVTCAGTPATVSAYLTGMPPWSVTWSDAVTQSGITSSPVLRGVSPAGTTSYSITSVSDAAGPGVAAGAADVTVNPLPAQPVVQAPASAPAGSTGLTASVAAHGEDRYQWQLAGGTVTSGASSNLVTFSLSDVAGVDTISVVETTPDGCKSPAGSANIVAVPVRALSLWVLPPCRVFDTREETGPAAASPILGAAEDRIFSVLSRCSIPSAALALSVNLTVVSPASAGYLTLHAGDVTPPFPASSLSFSAGRTRANNAIVQLSTDGRSTIGVENNSSDALHFVIDVNGYFR